MTPDISRWRSTSTYDYLDDLVSPDLGWEWLRRNGDYQRDYAETRRPACDLRELTNRVRKRWGLQFRCPSIAQRDRNSRLLVPRGRHQHRAADGRTFHTSRR